MNCPLFPFNLRWFFCTLIWQLVSYILICIYMETSVIAAFSFYIFPSVWGCTGKITTCHNSQPGKEIQFLYCPPCLFFFLQGGVAWGGGYGSASPAWVLRRERQTKRHAFLTKGQYGLFLLPVDSSFHSGIKKTTTAPLSVTHQALKGD